MWAGENNPMYGKLHSDETKEKIKNAQTDKTIFNLKNKNTGEIFSGTKCEFKTKYRFKRYDVYGMINGKISSYKGWVLSN